MEKSEIANNNAIVNGDASRLFIEKSEFREDEPINIKAIGKDNDWVGIYLPHEANSVRWYYIDEKAHGEKAPGSGNVQDIRKSAWSNGDYFPKFKDLPAGDYIIRLIPNGEACTVNQIAFANIKVLLDEDKFPKAPLSLKYELLNDTDGFAEGDVTVKVCKDRQENLDIRMFWADEKGKLSGYAPLAKFKVTGDTTVYHMPKGMIIPEGATRLIAYTALPMSDFYSKEYAECSLPKNSSMKLPENYKYCFTVVSDIHVREDKNHYRDINFKHMLEDVVDLTPDSIGVFIAGDMADSGKIEEYGVMMDLHKSVKNAPPLYLDVGNHDLRHGDFYELVQNFLQYATYPDGTHPTSTHYDFWLEGTHFIMIGDDYLVDELYTTLGKETLKWLDNALAENYRKDRPTFIFLHQSLYNTVAGSLPGEEWNGIEENSEQPLRDVLKKYPEAIMFNGHSHWTLDSVANMYPSDGNLPNIFNTASCGYLWQSYNDVKGEQLRGSEGYYVYVYDGRVILKGRDFQDNRWRPSAQYCVKYKD